MEDYEQQIIKLKKDVSLLTCLLLYVYDICIVYMHVYLVSPTPYACSFILKMVGYCRKIYEIVCI